MSGLNSGTRAGLEEALHALVPEASNHSHVVARGATRRKYSRFALGGSNPRPQPSTHHRLPAWPGLLISRPRIFSPKRILLHIEFVNAI